MMELWLCLAQPCCVLRQHNSVPVFFPEGGHHHLAIGYDADAFIFPVGPVLLPMNN